VATEPGGHDSVAAVIAPMVVAGLGIVLSIVGIFMVRCKEDASQKNLLGPCRGSARSAARC
jgi:Na+/H+-translocating membrane pyrophosphatase